LKFVAVNESIKINKNIFALRTDRGKETGLAAWSAQYMSAGTRYP
jgi:hypothetical protein